MKSKTKKITILIIVLILLGTGGWWFQNQKAINLCKEQCRYGATEEWVGLGFSKTKIIEGWLFRYGDGLERVFPFQEQCIDYCLIKNK